MIPYIHRDISWLAFNYRVLQEAMDSKVPLIERLRFLAIYSNNLDEFFKVRVANHRNLIRAGKKAKAQIDFKPEVVLQRVQKIVSDQQEEFSRIFENEIIPELEDHRIFILQDGELKEHHLDFISRYFNDYMLPFVQPVLLVEDKVKPFLNTGALYLAIHMEDPTKKDSKNTQYAIVKIPSDQLKRFLVLPSIEKDRHEVIFMDDIVRHAIPEIFPGYNILDTYSIKLTRDAELYIDDEYDGDLIKKIEKSLSRRNVGVASRLVYDRNMPKKMLKYLQKVFELQDFDLLPEGRYHNNSDFFKFPIFGKTELLNSPLEPMPHPILDTTDDFFGAINEEDRFLMIPFQTYDAVVRFFEEAATDPNVTHIKIIQYRVASKSRIMDALIKAVKNGKQVAVFVEVKARFDEKANLEWGEILEKAGVTVHYSMPGLKVHSKTAIVRRIENGKPRLYCYLATGNFHEGTAKVYSDIGIFTSDERLTNEAARLMTYLETKIKPNVPFEHMGVGQFNLRPLIEELIDNEVANVKKGKKGHIILKMNSIQDTGMINKLYEAGQKGVKIQLIIRGICSIVPGIKGISDNIDAISIVDRYLEHARVFIFHNDGDKKVYLSSADWMVRNLYHRVETMFPIYDTIIKEMIIEIMNIQLNDNVKARYIDYKNNNTYKREHDDIVIQSQIETYYFIKRRFDQKFYPKETV